MKHGCFFALAVPHTFGVWERHGVGLRRLGAILLLLAAQLCVAAPPLNSVTMYPAVPPNASSSTTIKPMVMLAASKDHTLFNPAYTDYEDLDGDGVIETTFKPDVRYYGYFDATKCYLYTYKDGFYHFAPSALASLSGTAATTSGSTVANRYVCGGAGQWSGNFLNWASMTRLDVLRKVLYGGDRFQDSTTRTLLQVARTGQDMHAFVKYYRGTDIRDYTPFSTTDLTKTTGANAKTYAGLTLCVRAAEDTDGFVGTPTMRLAKGNYRFWATSMPTACEWGSSFAPKLANFYGGKEAYQGGGGVAHEMEFTQEGQDGAAYTDAQSVKQGPDLELRVKVCDPTLIGAENCRAYPEGSSTPIYKPIGLLQEFGTPQKGSTAARAEFGLISGSYDSNLTAGALRKNMADLQDEIVPSTGQFCELNFGQCPDYIKDGKFVKNGIIHTLSRIYLYGRKDRSYTGSADQLPGDMKNGTLSAWGNPIGEMVVQALRYYAGLSSTDPISSTLESAVNLSLIPVKWSDPLADTNASRTEKYGKGMCRPMNIMAFSSSAPSFDGDDIDTQASGFVNLSRGSMAQFADAVGAAEGINGTVRSVGSVGGTFGETCSAKTISGLGSVSGVCPDAPALGGSYKVAGAALYANTNPIRQPAASASLTDLPDWALKVKTYATSLSGGVAPIEIPIPGTTPQKYVYITPESVFNVNSKRMPGALLRLMAISSSKNHGAYAVTWSDKLFGGDYGKDLTSYLRYDILPAAEGSSNLRLRVTTDVLDTSTNFSGAHGFRIIGTSGRDGRFLTHRIGGLSKVDTAFANADGYLCGALGQSKYNAAKDLSTVALSASGSFPGLPAGSMTGDGANACNDALVSSGQGTPVAISFEMAGANNAVLREPLWYAAKYGSFTPNDGNNSKELPDTAAKWDTKRNDGKACGGSTGLSCSDGEPDGYFVARRPELLEQRLRETLEAAVNTASTVEASGGVAVSSTTLNTGAFKYRATFNATQNSGTVEAYALLSDGVFSNTPSWSAGEKLTKVEPAKRVIITNDGAQGKAFRKPGAVSSVATLSDAYLAALAGSGNQALSNAQRDQLMDYLRGERSLESPKGIWRIRPSSNIMGPVVNSSPWLQGRPMAQFMGTLPDKAPSYASFVQAQSARERLLWVGAGDGLLHAFKAGGAHGGEPVLSYLPSPVVGRLSTIARDVSQTIASMDGSPFTGDVLTGTGNGQAWKTYLFSSLGRGGRAFFALDVTDPGKLTESNAANIFKWMFSANDDADLGYVLGDAKLHPLRNQATPIVRMNNGKTAVLLPNGTGSGKGLASVFVLFADGPSASDGTWKANTDYIKLATDSLASNGMVGVQWADADGNGTADVLYATDVQGRLWKFDVASADAAQWKSSMSDAKGALPLFEAKSGNTRLPVSTSPVLVPHPNGGNFVVLGTGKSFAAGDFPDSSKPQRVFGIYDNNRMGSNTVASDLSSLVSRTLERFDSGDVVVRYGKDAFAPDKHDGWYVNFANTSKTGSGEMVLTTPETRGDLIFFTGTRPATADANKCFSNPENTLYALSALSGRPEVGLFGTTTVGSTDVNLAGIAANSQKSTTVMQMHTGRARVTAVGADKSSVEFRPAARRQWREITSMRTKE